MSWKAKYIFILFTTLYCSIYLSAQHNKTDSLLSILRSTKEDTIKVNAYNSLFLEYEFLDSEKSKEYLDNALKIALKIDYKKGIAITHTYFGFFAEDKGNYSEALNNYASSLKIYDEIGNEKGIADAYINIGNIYFHHGNYPDALKNYFASLKIKVEIKDNIGIAAAHNNIGLVYSSQGNFQEALRNYQVSLKIRKEIGNNHGIATSYNNIGLVYKNLRNYSEALVNYQISLKIKQEIGDKKGEADSYGNIGSIYSSQGNYQEALKNHFKCLKTKEEISDRSGVASASANIANVFIKQKEYKKAREYFNKSKELSLKIRYKECLKEAYHGLSNLDSSIGNFKGAYENHKLYILYRDSLDNEETRKKTIQSQMTYDFEKKEAIVGAEHKKELENQEAIAEEKSRKQKVIISFVVGGLLFVLVFAGFIFRSLRVTRKQKEVIEQQKNIVEAQKQEVEEQKHLVEEHQKEIIDSITYARRIQRSLLPTEKYIEKTLNRLYRK